MKYILFGIILFSIQFGLSLLREEAVTMTRGLDMVVISLIFVGVVFFMDKKDKKNRE
ncbi:hypothetical protein [Caldalkalibacillus mannanilyticus]|uniref:hypothetical protein n=1 Tax=Caldalkalibacillus mannanilyticus TaxID=1418 RepID=UPI000AC3E804|nr:hypothetical protein [Caldalkalibacillus mannanilyticus]